MRLGPATSHCCGGRGGCGGELYAGLGSEEALLDARMMEMTDGDGQCVSGVMWLRRALQRKEHADHFLHLMFFRVAIAHDGLFDQPRRVLMNLDRGACGSKQGDTAHLAQFQRDLNI